MDWTKMSLDKIRSKRTNVQCDDRRPDQTTIYDQESIKYRPPPLSFFYGLLKCQKGHTFCFLSFLSSESNTYRNGKVLLFHLTVIKILPIKYLKIGYNLPNS